jgi:hypothetical protein
LRFSFSLYFCYCFFYGAYINAPVAGPAASAAYRDASLSQLEGCMAEAKALTAERLALGNTATERKRKEDIATRLADLRGNLDAIRRSLP